MPTGGCLIPMTFEINRKIPARAAPGRQGTDESAAEQPPRGAIFTLEQLEVHARALARSHELRPGGGRELLLDRLADNVEVIALDRPTDGDRRLLGRYEGIPLTSRGGGYFNVLPDRIMLFRENIARTCATEQELTERIRHTVVHEFAHFFGISDERLREIDRY